MFASPEVVMDGEPLRDQSMTLHRLRDYSLAKP
jgi:hypothetical protein